MALTYADVPLNVADSITADWIQHNISPEDVYEFERKFWPGPRLLCLTFWGFLKARPIKVNTLFWPTGARRFAVGHFLATDSRLEKIRGKVVDGGYQSAPLVMSWRDCGNSLVDSIETQMFMLPARPLTQIGGEKGQQLYLLTLVDERFFWWQEYTGNEDGGLEVVEGTTSWADLYTSIATQTGISVSADAIHADYLPPSACVNSYHENAPLLLDAIAFNVGHRIARSLSGTVYSRDPLNSVQDVKDNQALFSARSKQAGGELQFDGDLPLEFGIGEKNDLAPLLPVSVKIAFPHLHDDDYYVSEQTFTGIDWNALSVPKFGQSTTHPESQLLHCCAFADMTFSATPTPTNQTELDDLCTIFATHWYLWQRGWLDYKYVGIVPWEPDAFHDIEWTYRFDEVSTHITRSQTWNDLTDPLNHTGTCQSKPCKAITVRDTNCELHVHHADLLTFFWEDGFDVGPYNSYDCTEAVVKFARRALVTTGSPPQTSLADDVASGATSLEVADGSGFPGRNGFRVKINDEVIEVGAGAGTTTWSSLTRGVDGTCAAAHSTSDAVDLAGAYAWAEQVPDHNGKWTSGGGDSGTPTVEPVFDRNHKTGVPSGTYAWILPRRAVADGATTIASAAIDNTDTSVTVTDGSSFPQGGTSFHAMLGGPWNIQQGIGLTIDAPTCEIVLVTAGHGTNSWTITRGQCGTTAMAHPVGTTVTEIICDWVMDEDHQVLPTVEDDDQSVSVASVKLIQFEADDFAVTSLGCENNQGGIAALGVKIDVDWDGAASQHALLSTRHTDTVTHTAVRGDILYVNSTPAWQALSIGSAKQYLCSDGNEPTWDSVSVPTSAPVSPEEGDVWTDSCNLQYYCSSATHTVEKQSNKGQVDGYAGLDGSGYVPEGQLGSGTPTSDNFLRGDGAWSTTTVGIRIDDIDQGKRQWANFIQGAGISIGGNDDSGNDEVELQFDATYVGTDSVDDTTTNNETDNEFITTTSMEWWLATVKNTGGSNSLDVLINYDDSFGDNHDETIVVAAGDEVTLGGGYAASGAQNSSVGELAGSPPLDVLNYFAVKSTVTDNHTTFSMRAVNVQEV